MTGRVDHQTNTVEDAAAFERERGRDEDFYDPPHPYEYAD